MRIDSHQHFWNYDPVKDAWITDEMKIIQRDFLPQDLKPLLDATNLDGCIVVQADQSEEETNYLLHHAVGHDFIKGVVGWLDLCANTISERLEYYSSSIKLKGFRHIVQTEPAGFLLRGDFAKGIALLNQFNFTYDILINHKQLKEVTAFVNQFPNQKFVIDHIGKPDIKNGFIKDWATDIKQIAANENVYCKISGMVTEHHWQKWLKEDFIQYMDVIVKEFGTKRMLFGSDWPVCLLAASYKETVNIAEQYFKQFSKNEQECFWGLNAIEFYNL
jgi:L-fuconolactonase